MDPDTGEWQDLPEAPAGLDEVSPGQYGTGILAGSQSHYFATDGWVLDAGEWEWIKIPPLADDDTVVDGRSVTNAGEEMLVFGGARYGSTEPRGKLLNEAWGWSPRG